MWEAFFPTVLASASGAFIAILVKDIFERNSLKRSLGVGDVDYLVSELVELRSQASKYWQSDGSDVAQEAIIVGLYHSCKVLIQDMQPARIYDRKKLVDYLVSLEDILTGGNFGTKLRSADLERVKAVEQHLRILVAKVKLCRRR